MIRPALGAQHRPRHGLERVERAEQVRLEHLAPRVDRHAHDQVVARDAGVVDEDVDLAVRVERGLDQRLSGFRLRHVRLNGQRLAAERLDLLRGLLRRGRVARVREADVGALLGEPQRDGLADAARPARDHGRLASQIDHRLRVLAPRSADGRFADPSAQAEVSLASAT